LQDDQIDFTSLFCRAVNFNAAEWVFQLRDYPQAMLEVRDLRLSGRLIGAEQVGISRGL
jgi:hypothetical protein